MAYTLNTAEKNFLRNVAGEIVDAENNFAELCAREAGLSEADAFKVLALYKKHKLVKLDRVNRRYTPKHGGFYGETAIRNAIAMANA